MFVYPKKGFDALVNVTDVCDARCVMCNIWKNQLADDSFIPPETLDSVRPISSVSFAGGEPFLHESIVEVIRVVHDRNPSAKIIFSTNGFRTDMIVGKVREILEFHSNLQVTISLDGIGRNHDRIRGIPGAWEKVNRTFDELGKAGLKLRNFAFTITAENYDQLTEVYAHAKKKGAALSVTVAQSSAYLNVEVPPLDADVVYPYLNPLVEDCLRSWKPFNWARAFFLYGILRYLATGQRPILCDALSQQFMIDHRATVYSCHPVLWPAGNLKEAPLDQILQDGKTDELRTRAKGCHACWEVCTARSAIRNNLVKVGLWAAWNKLLAHARLRDGKKPTRLFPLTSNGSRKQAFDL